MIDCARAAIIGAALKGVNQLVWRGAGALACQGQASGQKKRYWFHFKACLFFWKTATGTVKEQEARPSMQSDFRHHVLTLLLN
jgi:hypothetical protein